ncbi:MAG TPA: FAD-binding protein [Caldilineae bacterium]|nr:FAD-binding protein [Caldilineae bacterium]
MNQRLQDFAADLKKRSRAEVYTDLPTRLLYSTDASNYQILPLAVVVPRDKEDVLATAATCIAYDLPMLPRGGGSSLAGQTVGEAVVIDFTKYMDNIVEIDAERQRVRTQPGISLGILNRRLAPHGLTVGPDPASADRATIGGIIGNNSTGSHSIVYGMMADHVEGVRTVLADGQDVWLGPTPWSEVGKKAGSNGVAGALYRQIPDLLRANAALIDAQFPKYWRRSGGYNLDYVRKQLAGDHLNLAKLLVGSEGTLGLILETEIGLVPIPKHKGLAILHYPSHEAAFRAVPGLLSLNPSAVELIDDYLLALTRAAPSWNKRLTFIEGDPTVVYIVEFAGDDEGYIADRMNALEQHLRRTGYEQAVVKITDRAGQANVWDVRKAGLGLLLSMRGDAKPLPGIEDVAVPPENLADYMADLFAAIKARGVKPAMYAHASAGCIHVRPILSLKTQKGIDDLVGLVTDAAALAKKYNGVPSSEHGDGLARSYLNPDFFGPDIYGLFQQVKSVFDPNNRMNPGKIVDPLPPEQNLRYGTDYQTISVDAIFDWSADGSFAQAVEMCNGAGVCRKLEIDVMCPSFKATKDEIYSTRGRANLLRSALAGDLPDGLHDAALADALDLCLGCKACKSECPSSVDMTKLKEEALAQKYRSESPPLSKKVFGNIDKLSALAAPLAPLANFTLDFAPTKWMIQKAFHIHPKRNLPHFQRRTFSARWRARAAKQVDDRPRLALYPDTFTEFNEPEVGLAAVKVLEAAGFRVEITQQQDCGRPALSQGLVPGAKNRAEKLIRILLPYAQAGIPVIGLEPSSVLTIRDDYPDLVPGPAAKSVAGNIFLFDEYLAELLEKNPDALPLKAGQHHFLVHGHCHQKALVGEEPLFKVLSAIPNAQAESTNAGCCGMAGAFGYDADHYDISVEIANDRMLPAIASHPDAIVIANGTSCRHQIDDLAGRKAVHLAVALAELVEINLSSELAS